MKIVELLLPSGIIDWAQFDPLHTDDKPLFGEIVGVKSDGKSLVQYRGARTDLNEPAPLPHFTVTDITSTAVIKWDNVKHTITARYDTELAIVGDIALPDGEYLAPIIDPNGKTQVISVDVTGGVIDAELNLPVSGRWEIPAKITLDTGDKITTDNPVFNVTVSKIKKK
jgi:hypothetical protein